MDKPQPSNRRKDPTLAPRTFNDEESKDEALDDTIETINSQQTSDNVDPNEDGTLVISDSVADILVKIIEYYKDHPEKYDEFMGH